MIYNKLYNGHLLKSGPQYNPLNLPPFTIRLKYIPNDYTPTFSKGTAVKVSEVENVWDLTYVNPDWTGILEEPAAVNRGLKKVYGANMAGVTNLTRAFKWCRFCDYMELFDTSLVTNMTETFCFCTSLEHVPAIDTTRVTNMKGAFHGIHFTKAPAINTENVTNMEEIFYDCLYLKNVPLLNTSKVTNVKNAFCGCTRVESGALALYRQMINQANPPTSHTMAFYHCGILTDTGTAELAQIPADWK